MVCHQPICTVTVLVRMVYKPCLIVVLMLILPSGGTSAEQMEPQLKHELINILRTGLLGAASHVGVFILRLLYSCRVSPQALAARLQDPSGPLIIDVRPRREFELAHLTGIQA